MNRYSAARPRFIAGGLVVAVVATVALMPESAVGGAGDLDRSFGMSGRAMVRLPGENSRLTGFGGSTGNGALLALASPSAGPSSVFVRLTKDGSVDRGFGADGQVGRPAGSGGDLVVDPGGGFTTAGGGSAFVLRRYRSDGAPDPNFGSDGEVVTYFSEGSASARRVSTMGDGRLVASGPVAPPEAEPNPRTLAPASLGVARYLSDGSLDSSFGEDGRVTMSFGRGEALPTAQLVQPDGKVLVAVYYEAPEGARSGSVLLRLNSDGSLDDTFGDRGRVDKGAAALALEPDGGLLLGGGSLLARLRGDGSPDPAFGDGGIAQEGLRDRRRSLVGILAMVIDRKGRILVGGSNFFGNEVDFRVARFAANGSLDRSFGRGGVVITPFGFATTDAVVRKLVLQPDDKVVAAGDANGGGRPGALAFARYHTEPVGSLRTVPRRQRAGDLVKRGVRVPLSCTQACRVRVKLLVDGGSARRLGLPLVAGGSDVEVPRPGTKVIVVPLRGQAASRVRRRQLKKLTIQLQFKASKRQSEALRRHLVITG